MPSSYVQQSVIKNSTTLDSIVATVWSANIGRLVCWLGHGFMWLLRWGVRL